MKRFLLSSFLLVLVSSFVYGSIIDDALIQVNEQLEQFQNINDLTLIYTQVTERIPLVKEGADYLAQKRAEKDTRDALQFLGLMDESKPFVLPAKEKENYEILKKRLSESYQKGRVASYECKVRLTKSQIGDNAVSLVQEAVSDMEGNQFYERAEDSTGLLKISKNRNAKDPQSRPEIETYKKENPNKKNVIPLPIEWSKFFNHTPKDNLEYEIESNDLIVLSYISRKEGYDDVPISLHLSKLNGRFVPVYYQEKYEHAIKSLKFEDYKLKKGVLVPVFIERSYLIPEDQAKTPKWQPYVVQYSLK